MNTKFEKTKFTHGRYVYYPFNGKMQFIARFKYGVFGSKKRKMITKLCKEFTVEVYIAELESGKAPFEIVFPEYWE